MSIPKKEGKDWWCFNCNKWIDKKSETRSFPIYASGIEIDWSYKCNHCNHETGRNQTINRCTTCGKDIRILADSAGWEEGKIKEDLCIHQKNNSQNGENNQEQFSQQSFNWNPWIVSGFFLTLIIIAGIYFLRNKKNRDE